MATFIGAFPGAMGPMLGWTAARGQIEWQGVALFAILFVWQFPHFMAICLDVPRRLRARRHSYVAGGPARRPGQLSPKRLFFAVVMIPVSLAPWMLGMATLTYAALALALGLLYLAYTIRFARILRAETEDESRRLARDLLKVSVLYLPLLFTALMLCAIAKP
jgi:protoheme IX farnesyltransferase